MLRKFVINLDRRQDRLDKFFSLNKVNFNRENVEIIPAVDGNEIDIEEYIERIDPEDYLMNRDKLKGVLGCNLSHFKCYEKMIKENIEYAIIMEDDLIVLDKLDKIMLLILGSIKQKIDLLFLNYSYPKEKSNESEYKVKNYDGKLYTTEMYLISKNYASKILKEFSDNLGACDVLLRKMIIKKGGKIGILDKPIGDQYDRNDSDIR